MHIVIILNPVVVNVYNRSSNVKDICMDVFKNYSRYVVFLLFLLHITIKTITQSDRLSLQLLYYAHIILPCPSLVMRIVFTNNLDFVPTSFVSTIT